MTAAGGTMVKVLEVTFEVVPDSVALPPVTAEVVRFLAGSSGIGDDDLVSVSKTVRVART